MQVSFNPYITNQQQVKQPTHKAVIQKYLKIAEKDVKKYGRLNLSMLRELRMDVSFKIFTPEDAVDTLEKIKQFNIKYFDLMSIEDYLKDYLNLLEKKL